MSKRVGTKSNYANGIKAENAVKKIYQTKGWNVKQSPGSRGAADLKCTKDNKSHFVQVKSSEKNTAKISSREIGRVKLAATKNSATSVIAKVDSKGTSICYAKTGGTVHL